MRRSISDGPTGSERLAYHDHDEERRIGEYVLTALRKPGERIKHVEALATRHLNGQRYSIWDVHTASSGRWWVIEPLTNLYAQKTHLSMDETFTFHVGLMQRMLDQERTPAPTLKRFATAWRKWQDAAATLAAAEERDQLQTVGLRLRESLLAWTRVMSKSLVSPAGVDRPKTGDFLAWSAIVADKVAAGSDRERLRAHLKSSATSTWHLASWLTHAQHADLGDAEIALEATRHVIDSFSAAILRSEAPIPDACPTCGSLRIVATEIAGMTSAICEGCGWIPAVT